MSEMQHRHRLLSLGRLLRMFNRRDV